MSGPRRPVAHHVPGVSAQGHGNRASPNSIEINYAQEVENIGSQNTPGNLPLDIEDLRNHLTRIALEDYRVEINNTTGARSLIITNIGDASLLNLLDIAFMFNLQIRYESESESARDDSDSDEPNAAEGAGTELDDWEEVPDQQDTGNIRIFDIEEDDEGYNEPVGRTLTHSGTGGLLQREELGSAPIELAATEAGAEGLDEAWRGWPELDSAVADLGSAGVFGISIEGADRANTPRLNEPYIIAGDPIRFMTLGMINEYRIGDPEFFGGGGE